jgi:hypothetical protein
MAIDLTQLDEWWDEAAEIEAEDESIGAFLDGLHRDLTSDRNRQYVILARDVNNKWRARQVIAFNADEAQSIYESIFTEYEVVGVANLEGSGHAIEWVNGWTPNTNT